MKKRIPNPIDHTIAHNIRKFRQESGMTIERLAELTGVSFQQMQKYERAINRINAGKLFIISQILKRPIEDFFEGLVLRHNCYNFTPLSQKMLKNQANIRQKDVLKLIKAFNLIENQQIKRYIVKLVCEIAGHFRRKKIKHQYS